MSCCRDAAEAAHVCALLCCSGGVLPGSSRSWIMRQMQEGAAGSAAILVLAQQQRGEQVAVLVNVLCLWCSLFVNTEDEYIPDSESVRQQRELHHQPQTCTLSQCFQLYTKEEQVGARLYSSHDSRPGRSVCCLNPMLSCVLQTLMCRGRRINLLTQH